MRRTAFWIGAAFAVLVMLPFPLGTLPGTSWLAELVTVPLEWGVDALAALLHVGPVSRMPTGSGDTLHWYLRMLVEAIVALPIGVAWSLAAPRRWDRRASATLRVWLRYWLAASMILYGLVKVLPMQFDVPLDFIYDQRVGDKSPMGLLWLFMGYSRPYTIACGLVEITAGVLLFVRRTTLIGALVAIVALTQIVLLNFCYDVPVKLFSLQLLAAAFAIAAPELRRIVIAALGRAVPELPPRVRGTQRYELARLVAKLVFVAGLVAWFGQWNLPRLDRPAESELGGTWDVTSFSLDGVERAPLATDTLRWQRIIVSRGWLVVRLMPDTRAHARVQVDEARKQLAIIRAIRRDVWTYALSGDTLVLDGAMADHRYHVTLSRTPAPLLETRGFHWIQEAPFHR